MGCDPKLHEVGAARLTYHQQINFGCRPEAALDFAVLGYLKKNRHVSSSEARVALAEALGIEYAGQ